MPAPSPILVNTLFYGDNLPILREYIADQSVDLVYLDPPFNSARGYNVLFKDHKGVSSESQIQAFTDTWKWSTEAEATYSALILRGDALGQTIEALRTITGRTSPMTAYLVTMAVRLAELHRVLKPTGSLYLHCDPIASHYLKVILDALFGARRYRDEIVWKRSASHGGAECYHDIHDSILFYGKGNSITWNSPRTSYDESYIESHYSKTDADGRRYQLVSAHGAGDGPPRRFGDREIAPPVGRHWMSQEHIDRMMADGNVIFTKSGMPRYKRYLTEEGVPLGDVWVTFRQLIHKLVSG